MRRTISSILLSLALLMVVFCFFGCDKEDTKDTRNDTSEMNSTQPLTNDQQTDVQKAIANTVQILSIENISEQDDSNSESQSSDTSMKKVKISVVDLSKVYKYFVANYSANEFDLQKIEQFIAENQDNPAFLTEYSIEAEVIAIDGTATIGTAALQDVFNSQAEEIMRERVSEFNDVEVDVVPIQTEEND